MREIDFSVICANCHLDRGKHSTDGLGLVHCPWMSGLGSSYFSEEKKMGVLKVVYNREAKASKSVTLNDIPEGQVFRGTIKSSGCSYTAVFHKVRSVWGGDTNVRYEVLVVNMTNDAGPCIFTKCCKVLNYEALNATITIEP